jgi:hypothetical protein
MESLENGTRGHTGHAADISRPAGHMESPPGVPSIWAYKPVIQEADTGGIVPGGHRGLKPGAEATSSTVPEHAARHLPVRRTSTLLVGAAAIASQAGPGIARRLGRRHPARATPAGRVKSHDNGRSGRAFKTWPEAFGAGQAQKRHGARRSTHLCPTASVILRHGNRRREPVLRRDGGDSTTSCPFPASAGTLEWSWRRHRPRRLAALFLARAGPACTPGRRGTRIGHCSLMFNASVRPPS